MIKLISAIIVAFFATIANADSYITNGRIIEINPVYTNVLRNAPKTVCRNVEVPVYGTVQGGGDAAGGALLGMLLGGAIGKGVTGKDNGAAAGAVIGGLIGADKGANGTRRVITGYKTERQCSEEFTQQQVSVVNEYDLVYDINGHRYTMRVNSAMGQRAYIGKIQKFRISYQPLN